MNPEIKVKWLEALRSGEYTQARGFMKINGGFCCLGVLCDMQGANFELGGDFGLHAVSLDTAHVPAKFAGGLVYGEQNTLADMNDSGSSFSAIADYIEENL